MCRVWQPNDSLKCADREEDNPGQQHAVELPSGGCLNADRGNRDHRDAADRHASSAGDAADPSARPLGCGELRVGLLNPLRPLLLAAVDGKLGGAADQLYELGA